MAFLPAEAFLRSSGGGGWLLRDQGCHSAASAWPRGQEADCRVTAVCAGSCSVGVVPGGHPGLGRAREVGGLLPRLLPLPQPSGIWPVSPHSCPGSLKYDLSSLSGVSFTSWWQQCSAPSCSFLLRAQSHAALPWGRAGVRLCPFLSMSPLGGTRRWLPGAVGASPTGACLAAAQTSGVTRVSDPVSAGALEPAGPVAFPSLRGLACVSLAAVRSTGRSSGR